MHRYFKNAVFAIVLLVVAPSRGQVQPVPDWFAVSPDESALVIAARGKVEGLTFSLTSDGQVLDETKWTLPFPFLKQYRLPPAEYQLSISGEKNAAVISAAAGKITYVDLLQYEELSFKIEDIQESVDPGSFYAAADQLLSVSEWAKASPVLLQQPPWSVDFVAPKQPALILIVIRRRPPPPPPPPPQ